MTFTLIAIPQSFCGESYRVPDCSYCLKNSSCEAAQKVKALWVSTTQRA